MERFYGYKHWTLEVVPRCFNVGKGVKGRSHSKDRNHKWHAIVKRLGLHVEVCVGFKCDNHDHDYSNGKKCPANEEACAWEIENIALMGTFSTNHSHNDLVDIGCNFTKGGEGLTGYIWTPEHRINVIAAMKGHVKPPRIAEHREHLSLANTGRKDNEVAKLHKSLAGRKRFQSIIERERHRAACNIPEAKQRHRQAAQNRPREAYIKMALTHQKTVMQLDEQDNVIAMFASVKEAALTLGSSGNSISKAARGLQKKAAGFRWKYL